MLASNSENAPLQKYSKTRMAHLQTLIISSRCKLIRLSEYVPWSCLNTKYRLFDHEFHVSITPMGGRCGADTVFGRDLHL